MSVINPYRYDVIAPPSGFPPGALAVWEMEETSGFTAFDATGNGHDFETGNCLLNQAGIPNKSYYFNGSNSYARALTSNYDLSPDNGHTISVWCKVLQFDAVIANLMSRTINSNGNNVYYFNIVWPSHASIPNQLRWYYVDTSGGLGIVRYNPPSDIYTGNWLHFCGTRNFADMQLYVNGVDVKDTDNGGGNGTVYQAATTVKDYIGGYNNFSGNDPGLVMNGNIGQTGIWDRALTPTEVSNLYNGGLGLSYS